LIFIEAGLDTFQPFEAKAKPWRRAVAPELMEQKLVTL